MVWDFTIQTDYYIEHNKRYIGKRKKNCLIIDIACAFDTRKKVRRGKDKTSDEKALELSIGLGDSSSHWYIGYNLKRIWEMDKTAGVELKHGALAASVFAADG